MLDLSFLGESRMSKSGEVQYCCPFCPENGKGPDTEFKLYVNESKGMYICFRCEESGRISWLFKKLGEDIPLQKMDFLDRVIDEFLTGPSRTEDVPVRAPDVQPLSPEAIQYLRSRGLGDWHIQHYKIVEGVGRMAGRIVFPEYLSGRLIFWVARAYMPGVEPRYLNPGGANRKGAVWNLENVTGPDVTLAEGVFSAISAGIDGVATYGKAVSDLQLSRIIKKGFLRYWVVLDPDATQQSIRLAQRLHSYASTPFKDADVRMVRPPAGEDPSSLGQERYLEFKAKAIKYEPEDWRFWGGEEAEWAHL